MASCVAFFGFGSTWLSLLERGENSSGGPFALYKATRQTSEFVGIQVR